MDFDVFLCHHTVDKPEVKQIAQRLKQQGLRPWLDEWELRPGFPWHHELEQQIATIPSAAIFIGEGGRGPWQDMEIEALLRQFVQRKCPVIPVLLPNCLQIPPLPPFLGGMTWVDFRRPDPDPLARLIWGIRGVPPTTPELSGPATAESRWIGISVAQSDIRTFPADVVLLKYAQAFYGVDRIVAEALERQDQRGVPEPRTPEPWEHCLVHSAGEIAAERILFVGVPPLDRLHYEDLRQFAGQGLAVLATEMPGARHVAMTLHGANIGFDENEAFSALLLGLQAAIQAGDVPPTLDRITFVELNGRRARNMMDVLEHWAKNTRDARQQERGTVRIPVPLGQVIGGTYASQETAQAGRVLDTKPYAVVTMSCDEEWEDLWYFGISAPVQKTGLLCERIDPTSLTAEGIDRMKRRIDNAEVVIAELTAASPISFLELGYAWGRQRPTILLAKKGPEPSLALPGERRLEYTTLRELSQKLEAELLLMRKHRQ